MVVIYILIILVALFIIGVHIAMVWRGAPYVKSPDFALKKLPKITADLPAGSFADLGSGDGRVVELIAQTGRESYGYEISPWLVVLSRCKLRNTPKTRIILQSLWKANLSQHQIIYVYGFPYIMKNLEKKLEAQLTAGQTVITLGYKLPARRPDSVYENLFIYHFPRRHD